LVLGFSRWLLRGAHLWLSASGNAIMKLYLVYGSVFGLAIFNAFSPYSPIIFAFQGMWYPNSLPAPTQLMLILSGVFSSLLHLFITGVPAAVLEKLASIKPLPTGLLWLGLMLLPTALTLRHLGWA
jgi:hypothetical protein